MARDGGGEEVMTKGAERILGWGFLIPLIGLVTVIVLMAISMR